MYVGKALGNGIFDLSRRCGYKQWPSSFQEYSSTLLVSENSTQNEILSNVRVQYATLTLAHCPRLCLPA